MKDFKNIIKWGKETLSNESKALEHLESLLDDKFARAVEALFNCKGKVVVSGMGKSGHIGNKIAATFSSTGTPAVFINPAEGGHGDLGIVVGNDVIIAISKSGETREISVMLPFIKRLGVFIISITNNLDNTLARAADISLGIDIGEEACPNNLAPTTSTTATLALGDALAVALMKMRDFKPENFAMFHPAGSLGKQLLRVEDLMETDDLPLVKSEIKIRDVLQEILSHRNRGVAIVVDDKGKLEGILVDGDLKRLLLKYDNLLEMTMGSVMTKNPKTISKLSFVGEALKLMEGKITSLIIVDSDNRPEGLIHIHDILEAKVI
ncbi:MAG: KpsF/GutQ family sugar-phosphate isomerase [Spirochaetes bacterium]|nr:KpsF/GutQ family sugar-phosphate isomerase [Spirochaetota bacterium]